VLRSSSAVASFTARARHSRIHVVSGLVEDAISTKAAKTLLGKISERKNLLLVVERGDEAAWLSVRNLPQVHILAPGQLNTYDVIVSDDVVFTKDAFDRFTGADAESDETETDAAELEGSDA
jgi:large subunit ribosomal protein L4